MSFYIKKNIVTQCIFEFFCTGFIAFSSMFILATEKLTIFNFSLFQMNLICSLGVIISIYLSAPISGAHLNPAITIFFWLFSKFNKKKVLPYIIAQLLGVFFYNYNIFFILQKTYLV